MPPDSPDFNLKLNIRSQLECWIVAIGFRYSSWGPRPHMPSSHSACHIRLPIGTLTLVLLLALIGWGLQYKTSLYQRDHRHSTSVPPAKLLSEAERSSASKGVISSPVLTSPVGIASPHVPAAGYDRWSVRGERYFLFISQDAPLAHRLCTRFFLHPPPFSEVAHRKAKPD